MDIMSNKSAVKRRSSLGSLDQDTTPNTKLNTLEMSDPPATPLPPPPPPPPPPKKKKKKKTKKKNSSSLRCHVKFQTQQIPVATKIVTVKQSHCHCETVYDQLAPLTEYGEWLENWLISSPMSLEAQLSSLSLFSDTVRLSCAFAPLFMVHFQYCFLSIYKIHIIIEMLCIANIDFLDD